jgi:23S rRNA pseudouridine1911/1915/1917 synthase
MELGDPCYKARMKKAKKPGPSLAGGAERSEAQGEARGAERSWRGIVGPEGAARADVFIAESEGALSRSQIKARGALIRVNGIDAKPSRSLKAGDRIELLWTEEDQSSIEAEDIPLSILYRDERVLVVDKAQGMVTHPGAGNRHGTFANALLFIARQERASQAELLPERAMAARGGIVHRLDKDTSGLIIAALDLEAQVFLSEQFKERLARKEYLAITRGLPSPPFGRIADRLGRDKRERKRFASVPEGGKVAVTDYRVLSYWGGAANQEAYALVSLRPKTGRTHQLRVHLAGLGTPILGDPIYGKKDPRFPGATLMLHAFRLKIGLPGRDSSSLFKAPLPQRFKAVLRALAIAFGRGTALPARGGQADHGPR